jgi:hypothetical protein
MPVEYVPGSESPIHAEFREFLSAKPNEGADSLAILHHVAIAGVKGACTPSIWIMHTEG